VEIRSRGDLARAAVLLSIGAVLTIAVVLAIGGEGVIEELSRVKIEFFLLAILVEVLYVCLWAVRWALIVRAQGQMVPRDIIALTFSGAFFNNITPVSKTGGEPVRGYLIGRSTDSTFEEGMASVVVDRIFDMVPFVLICLLTFVLAWIFGLGQNVMLMSIILIGLLVSTGLSAFFIYGSLRKHAGVRLVFFFIDKLEPLISRFRSVDELRITAEEAIDRFYDGISSISGNRRVLVVSLLISLALWMLVVLRLKVIFLSLGADQSFLLINMVAVAMIFAGFIPFLPGGLVVTEGVMVVLLTGLGIKADISGSAVLLDRLVSYWFLTFVGGLASLYLGLKLDILKTGNRD